MKKKVLSFDLQVFESFDALSAQDAKLMEAAIAAREHAYAPYSKFKVGAAVLMGNGEIVIGNNQENASYPSGLCAERVAVFQAGARYPGVAIKAVAISVASENQLVNKPAAPCGNCRQSIIEYEQRQKDPIAIMMMGETGEIYKSTAVAHLLPLAFDSSYL